MANSVGKRGRAVVPFRVFLRGVGSMSCNKEASFRNGVLKRGQVQSFRAAAEVVVDLLRKVLDDLAKQSSVVLGVRNLALLTIIDVTWRKIKNIVTFNTMLRIGTIRV